MRGVIQQWVYEHPMNSIDKLKQHLVIWCLTQSAAEHYSQQVVEVTESVQADEHFEHQLCACEKVMDT